MSRKQLFLLGFAVLLLLTPECQGVCKRVAKALANSALG
jgi:hypothetical protein